MADIVRGASAVWNGNLKEGNGQVSTESKTLNDAPYTFVSRFETGPGTNPEELVGAAHAACYSMAFANTLAGKGYTVHYVKTQAAVTISPPRPGGRRLTQILLTIRGKVDGIDNATFVEVAKEAHAACPISNALSAVPIELDAALE